MSTAARAPQLSPPTSTLLVPDVITLAYASLSTYTQALRLFGVLEGFDWLASALDHARQQDSGSGGAAANVNGSSNAGSSLGLLRAVMPAGWRSRRQARQRQQARQLPEQHQQQQQQRSVIHRWAAGAMRGAAGGSHPYGASTGAATATKSTSSGGAGAGGGGGGPVLPSAEERLSGWLAEPVAAGDSDDAFLAALEACEPGVRWDHFAHLRLAWLYLVGGWLGGWLLGGWVAGWLAGWMGGLVGGSVGARVQARRELSWLDSGTCMGCGSTVQWH